jgi:hypothetical protein
MTTNNSAQTMIHLENNPPKPVNGDGEVSFQTGSLDLTLKWEKGVLTDIASADQAFSKDGMNLIVQTKGVIEQTCWVCYFDTDTGAWACFQRPC